MAEIRCYLVIDAAATRTEAQWNTLTQAVKNKPMVLAVRQKAQTRDQPHYFVNVDRFSVNPVRRYRLGDFEIDSDDRVELEAVLDVQCGLRAIVEVGVRAKFRALIQAELQEAATDLGFGALAPLLTVTIIGLGNRADAIAEAQAYVLANASIWETAV